MLAESAYICVAECIIQDGDKFLVIQRPEGVHAGGLLAFPGGKVDLIDGADGKSPFLEAAKRETLEEVGINLLDPLRFVTSSLFEDSNTGIPIVDCIFHCRLEKSSNVVHASEREAPEFFWLTLEEIKNHPKSPVWVKNYINQIN